jgi:hypothetical protein
MREKLERPFENYPKYNITNPAQHPDKLEIPKSGKELRRERRKLERK